MAMEFSRFTTISFDCYGTLIDWEAGILPVLRSVLVNHGQSLADAAILELYGEFEAEAESGPYQSYREVLQFVVRSFAKRLQFEATSAEIHSLHESVHAWPAFPDTVAALRELHKRLKLVVISNIDDDLFAETRKHLGVEFDGVITAQQARSYKPSVNNFQIALTAARWAERLSRCCTGAVAGDLDGVGKPEVGSSRDWRGSSFGWTARPGGSRFGQSGRNRETRAGLSRAGARRSIARSWR
jgi:2-haloalkanoic acid dehalogenase type II